MANKAKKTTKKVERTDYHHLGSPDYGYECGYHKGNMEYTIGFRANGSNTHFLGDHVQIGDELYLGLSEEDFENLLEGMIEAATDRMRDKLERLNNYRKEFYTKELDGEDWESNTAWNRLAGVI